MDVLYTMLLGPRELQKSMFLVFHLLSNHVKYQFSGKFVTILSRFHSTSHYQSVMFLMHSLRKYHLSKSLLVLMLLDILFFRYFLDIGTS